MNTTISWCRFSLVLEAIIVAGLFFSAGEADKSPNSQYEDKSMIFRCAWNIPHVSCVHKKTKFLVPKYVHI